MIENLAKPLCWTLYNMSWESAPESSREFCRRAAAGQLKAIGSVFQDQAAFMIACGQTVDQLNLNQFNMYLGLIEEEHGELKQAVVANDMVEIFDAIMDSLVVTIGAGLSLGLPLRQGWDEVTSSNMTKVDPDTGKVRRREDGKILKGENYVAPDLARILKA
jgi:predicted HAD superfamily Cof-like phosphohydrolase